MTDRRSKIILISGASSAGKSTLAKALQALLDEPFLRFSLDLLMFGGEVLPARRDTAGAFSWASMRPLLFDGYYRCISALASAGNNIVVDHIIETQDQLDRLVHCLHHSMSSTWAFIAPCRSLNGANGSAGIAKSAMHGETTNWSTILGHTMRSWMARCQ